MARYYWPTGVLTGHAAMIFFDAFSLFSVMLLSLVLRGLKRANDGPALVCNINKKPSPISPPESLPDSDHADDVLDTGSTSTSPREPTANNTTNINLEITSTITTNSASLAHSLTEMYHRHAGSTRIAIDGTEHLVFDDAPEVYKEYVDYKAKASQRFFWNSLDPDCTEFYESIDFTTADTFTLATGYKRKIGTMDTALSRSFYKWIYSVTHDIISSKSMSIAQLVNTYGALERKVFVERIVPIFKYLASITTLHTFDWVENVVHLPSLGKSKRVDGVGRCCCSLEFLVVEASGSLTAMNPRHIKNDIEKTILILRHKLNEFRGRYKSADKALVDRLAIFGIQTVGKVVSFYEFSIINETHDKYVLISQCVLPIHLQNKNELLYFYEFLACIYVKINEFQEVLNKIKSV